MRRPGNLLGFGNEDEELAQLKAELDRLEQIRASLQLPTLPTLAPPITTASSVPTYSRKEKRQLTTEEKIAKLIEERPELLQSDKSSSALDPITEPVEQPKKTQPVGLVEKIYFALFGKLL